MILCKNGECPHGECGCCCDCPSVAECDNRCGEVPETCGRSTMGETTDLTLFQSKAFVVMENIVALDKQKKQLEAQDKVVRQELQKLMDEYGVKKFENDILAITYVEPTTRTTIDSARLKKELPVVAEKYSKISQVKGSVRIEVK